MENRARALMAGLFLILIGLGLAVSVWWLGGEREASRDLIVVTRQNVSGLNLQGQVRYRGINVGRVEEIRLDPDDVRHILIRVRIDANVPLTGGTVAKLGYQGVTGIAHILLEDTGKDPERLAVTADLPRIMMQPSLLDELSDFGTATVRRAHELLINANALLGPENRTRIGNALSNLERASASLDTTLVRMQHLLAPEAVRRLHATLGHTEAAAAGLRPVLAEMPELLAETRQMLARFDTLAQRMTTVVGHEGGGSVADMVPQWTALAAELGGSVRRLNRLLRNLEQSPQSLISGPPSVRPGPGEEGFEAPAGREEGR